MTRTNSLQKNVYRFAPSSNGPLHLGHAYSALLNAAMARETDGRFLLRIEDIDETRCNPMFEAGIYRDLQWLGLDWETPVRRQSEHFADYRAALDTLVDMGLVYPSFLSRGEVRAHIAHENAAGKTWPLDPDGVPLFPDTDRQRSEKERCARMAAGEPYAWRLDIRAARAHVGTSLSWSESGNGPAGETGTIAADPLAWGDVVIARKEMPSSYHLSVVVDDMLQGITHVVRGRDLFHATAIHRVLQEVLGFQMPLYHHHDLIMGADGQKLSKSSGSTGIEELRVSGAAPEDVVRMIGPVLPDRGRPDPRENLR